VFGVKFRPGGFRAFSGSAISRFANRTIPASCVFGSDIQALETVVADSLDDGTKIEAANAFFRARAPERDPRIAQASQLVERILQEPGIRTVDDLASRAGVAKRNLQRLFQEYVGVSPKWVIRRYRLHELVETLNSGSMPDWPQLALDLGYFDQAHLINDFKSIIGVSPMQYLKIT
jgi:AraC-like DNA-binding protein